MFDCILDDVSIFRDSLATISELIEESQLKIKKNGIELLASDRAVVAVVDFKFYAKNFKEYNYSSDISIGINLSNLLQVLKRVKANEIVEFHVSESNLSLLIKGESTRRFTLPLIDIREEVPSGIERLSFPVKVEFSSELLNDGIEDADLVSDSIIFEVSKNDFIIKAEGDSSSTELRLEHGKQAKIAGDKNAKARYSLDYLKKMIKARKISSVAILEFDTNYPLRLTFAQPEKISLSFILAPRIEE
jgi:proliferating cell nuclear antigen